MKKFGLVIADDCEFEPVQQCAKEMGGSAFERHGNAYVKFCLENNIEVIAVLCGIGKVNAAFGAAALCCEDQVDAVINFGLSGAIHGVYKNDLVIGTKYIEHDFDLTPMGYEISFKPQAVSHFTPDPTLFDQFMRACPQLKPCVLVTGDMFVSDSAKKKFLKERFNAGCCDMESAAIAQVCHKMGIPFVALRCISDDADENAPESYTKENEQKKDNLMQIVHRALQMQS